jgi:polyisoprenoid-binding protein YceI
MMRFPSSRFILSQSLLLGVFLVVFAHAWRAQAIVIPVNAEKSHVDFTVADNLHTVHGTFRMKEGSITLDPATHKIAGTLTVDVSSGDSGNHARDKRMHKEILESEQYPLSTFTAESLEGDVSEHGDSHIKIHGKLNLHGKDHPMILDVLLHREGDTITAKTSFGIPFVDWGLKDPSNFLFRMEKTVHMDVEIQGSIKQ